MADDALPDLELVIEADTSRLEAAFAPRPQRPTIAPAVCADLEATAERVREVLATDGSAFAAARAEQERLSAVMAESVPPLAARERATWGDVLPAEPPPSPI